jgi:hypothetical protein
MYLEKQSNDLSNTGYPRNVTLMTKQLNINLLTAVFLLLFFQLPGRTQVGSRDFNQKQKILFLHGQAHLPGEGHKQA